MGNWAGGEDMDTSELIKKKLESIASVTREAQSIEDLMGEMNILTLLCEKNLRHSHRPLYDLIEPDVSLASRFLFRLENMMLETGGASRMVGENVKALVFATLEHLILRLGISATFENPFTLFTNAVSFIMNRISEYAYVKSAKESEEIYLNKARMFLREDLWEIVMTNPAVHSITPEGAEEINHMIAGLVKTIDEPRSTALYIQFYVFIYYIYILKAFESARDFRPHPVSR
jgi:hypothetical protein